MKSYQDVANGMPMTNKCLVWAGTITNAGVPVTKHNGKQIVVSRLVYQLYVGPLKDGGRVTNLCLDRRCVNPQHLTQTILRSNGSAYSMPLVSGIHPRYRDVLRKDHGYVVKMSKPDYTKSGFVTALEAYNFAQNIRNNGGINDEIVEAAKLREGVLVISEVKDYTDQSADKTTCWIWDGAQTVNATDPRSGKDYSTSPARAMWHCLIGVIPMDKRLRSICKKDGCVRPSHRQPAAPTPWGRNAQTRETYDFLSEEDFDSIHKYDREYDFNFSHQMRRTNV